MTAGTIVSKILKQRGITRQLLAEKLGYKFPSAITGRLASGNAITTELLLTFLKEANCELVIRSKQKDHSEWVITADDSDAEQY